MRDATRAAVTRRVYQRLADPDFRRCLTATAADGTRPIIVALRDDPMRDLTEKIRRAGGSANVVVPAHNGFLALEMEVERSPQGPAFEPDVQVLATDCTVGLFMARLHVDGGGTRYRLVTEPGEPSFEPGRQMSSSGRARVVALGS